MIKMGDSGGNGQRWVSQRETATVAADCIQQQWQLNWQLDGNTIAMAGWRDGCAIVMLMGDGREKATQWKMVMVAAQSRWAMATVVQWTACYLDELLSLSKIVDRLNFITWRHGTHDKVWDTTTITSLRKVEAEEELDEKVEV
jgi:hypothetical protein